MFNNFNDDNLFDDSFDFLQQSGDSLFGTNDNKEETTNKEDKTVNAKNQESKTAQDININDFFSDDSSLDFGLSFDDINNSKQETKAEEVNEQQEEVALGEKENKKLQAQKEQQRLKEEKELAKKAEEEKRKQEKEAQLKAKQEEKEKKQEEARQKAEAKRLAKEQKIAEKKARKESKANSKKQPEQALESEDGSQQENYTYNEEMFNDEVGEVTDTVFYEEGQEYYEEKSVLEEPLNEELTESVNEQDELALQEQSAEKTKGKRGRPKKNKETEIIEEASLKEEVYEEAYTEENNEDALNYNEPNSQNQWEEEVSQENVNEEVALSETINNKKESKKKKKDKKVKEEASENKPRKKIKKKILIPIIIILFAIVVLAAVLFYFDYTNSNKKLQLPGFEIYQRSYGTTLIIDEIENAQGYEVVICEGDKETVITSKSSTVEIASYLNQPGEFVVKVRAIGLTENAHSDYSETKTIVNYVKLSAPIVFSENGKLTWNNIPNATEYRVYYKADAESDTVAYETILAETQVCEFSLNKLHAFGMGEYNIYVQAIADETLFYTNSDYSQQFKYVYTDTLQQPESASYDLSTNVLTFSVTNLYYIPTRFKARITLNDGNYTVRELTLNVSELTSEEIQTSFYKTIKYTVNLTDFYEYDILSMTILSESTNGYETSSLPLDVTFA